MGSSDVDPEAQKNTAVTLVGLCMLLALNITVSVLAWISFLAVRYCFPTYFNQYNKASHGYTARPLVTGNSVLLKRWWWLSNGNVEYEADFLHARGLDALMYLRTLRASFHFCVISSVVGIPVLFVDSHSGGGDLSGMDMFTLSNVTFKHQAVLWIHIAHAFIVGLAAMLLIGREWRHFTMLRRQRLRNSQEARNYSVLLRDLPSLSKSQIHQLVLPITKGVGAHRIASDLNDGVADVVTIPRNNTLLRLLQKRNKAVRAYEKALLVYEKDPDKRPTHRIPHPLGRKTDSISHYEAEISRLDNAIAEKRSQMLSGSSHERCLAAIVVFENMQHALVASQTLLVHEDSGFRAGPVCDRHNIHYENLSVATWSRTLRGCFVSIVLLALVFFWGIPVAFISGLSNLETLAKIPGLKFLVKLVSLDKYLKALLQSVLPTIALLIFMALLPTILKFLTSIEATHTTISAEWRGVMNKYTFFLVINVVLVSVVGNMVLQRLNELIESPKEIIHTLGITLPSVSSFFIQYFVAAIGSYSMRVLRIGNLISIFLQYKVLASTPREKAIALEPGEFHYGVEIALRLLFFCIAALFSSLAPIVSFVGVLYFATAMLVDEYNLTHVYRNRHEGDGDFFPSVSRWWVFSLILAQITLLGALSLKGAYTGVWSLLGLMVFTGVSAYMIEARHKRSCKHLSIADFLPESHDLPFAGASTLVPMDPADLVSSFLPPVLDEGSDMWYHPQDIGPVGIPEPLITNTTPLRSVSLH